VVTSEQTNQSLFKTNKSAFTYELDKIQEDVLESNVTLAEWKQECERVEKQLIMPI
jgi:hypothetical protein